jgi:outer membrane protein TolC
VKVEDKLVRNIRSLKQRLGSNAESIGALKEREDAIRKTFEAELERYRTLVAAKAEAED